MISFERGSHDFDLLRGGGRLSTAHACSTLPCLRWGEATRVKSAYVHGDAIIMSFEYNSPVFYLLRAAVACLLLAYVAPCRADGRERRPGFSRPRRRVSREQLQLTVFLLRGEGSRRFLHAATHVPFLSQLPAVK